MHARIENFFSRRGGGRRIINWLIASGKGEGGSEAYLRKIYYVILININFPGGGLGRDPSDPPSGSAHVMYSSCIWSQPSRKF